MSLGICKVGQGQTIVYQVASDFNYHVQVDKGGVVLFRPQVSGRTIRILGSVWGEGECKTEGGNIIFCSAVNVTTLSIGGNVTLGGPGGVPKPTSLIPGTPVYAYTHSLVENI